LDLNSLRVNALLLSLFIDCLSSRRFLCCRANCWCVQRAIPSGCVLLADYSSMISQHLPIEGALATQIASRQRNQRLTITNSRSNLVNPYRLDLNSPSELEFATILICTRDDGCRYASLAVNTQYSSISSPKGSAHQLIRNIGPYPYTVACCILF
jgi:hypothetical protein